MVNDEGWCTRRSSRGKGIQRASVRGKMIAAQDEMRPSTTAGRAYIMVDHEGLDPRCLRLRRLGSHRPRLAIGDVVVPTPWVEHRVLGGLVEGGGEQARAGNRMAMDSSVDSLLLPPQNGVLCPASFWEGLPWDDALEGPQPVHIRIPHVRQSSNWDCGLACIQMVLR